MTFPPVSLAISSAFNIMNEAPSWGTILTHSTVADYRHPVSARTLVHHLVEPTFTQASTLPPARRLPPASSPTLCVSTIHGILQLNWEFYLTHTGNDLKIGI